MTNHFELCFFFFRIFSSSYGNGCWYRVQAVRMSQNATLTVNQVGSMDVPDSRFVDTGEEVMAVGHVMIFGALLPNR